MDPALEHSGAPAAHMSSGADAEVSRKRTAQDDGASSHRSKRNRYVAVACNECKRRKIRCNGQTPCERCGNMHLECVYAPNYPSNNLKDATEIKQLGKQIRTLQWHVEFLFQTVNALRGSLGQDSLPQPQPPEGFDASGDDQGFDQSPVDALDPALSSDIQRRDNVARSSTSTYTSSQLKPESNSRSYIGAPHPGGYNVEGDPLHPDKDPIWGMKQEEAARLCRVYEDQIAPLYPIVNTEKLVQHMTKLFHFIAAAWKSGLIQGGLHGSDALSDPPTDTLKLVLAIAILCDSGRPTELSKALFDSVSESNARRHKEAANVDFIRVTILQAIYYVHSDDDRLAHRAMRLASTLSLEMGLQREGTYWNRSIFQEGEDLNAFKTMFWTMYILEHRLCASVGVPFALSDSDIDIDPEDGSVTSPFIASMVRSTRLAVKISQAVSAHAFQTSVTVDMDPDINGFEESIPENLRYIHPDTLRWQNAKMQHNTDINSANVSKAIFRQRVILFLRGKVLRLAWRRFMLNSASTSGETEQRQNVVMTALTSAVELAHEITTVLFHVVRSGRFTYLDQALLSPFVPSAAALAFMPTLLYPDLFQGPCRPDRQMALQILRKMTGPGSTQAMAKLRRAVADFQTAARSSLHTESRTNHQVQHHDAAVVMAGLAGHAVDKLAYSAGQANNQHQAKDTEGAKTTSTDDVAELMNLLEQDNPGLGGSSSTHASENSNKNHDFFGADGAGGSIALSDMI